MSRSLLPLLLATATGAALCACGVKPQGALKDVVEGNIFTHTPRNPAEEKKIEETKRQIENQTPPPKDDQGGVQFRIPL